MEARLRLMRDVVERDALCMVESEQAGSPLVHCEYSRRGDRKAYGRPRRARYLSKRRIKGAEIGRRSNLRIEGAGIGRRMTFTQIFPRRIWLGPQMGRRRILSTQLFPRST